MTGDILHLSYVFQIASVGLNRAPDFKDLVSSSLVETQNKRPVDAVFDYLNRIVGHPDYVTEHFSRAGAAGRLFFTVENAQRIDAIRTTIADWRHAKLISRIEECLLLAALIDAADKVANTAGTYYAHLKRITRKAGRELKLTVPSFVDNHQQNLCHLSDARELTASCAEDILYLDPPCDEGIWTRRRWRETCASARFGSCRTL